ncbi:MAG: N-acetylmuramoyl-L-alanine amidase [Nodosilinea sp.]
MRLKQLLTGVVSVAGVCLFGGLPAKATARLQTWQFDTGQNRLMFTTDTGVQPQVTLLLNPKRLVIDLPGILSDDAVGDQFIGGAVKAVRVTQADAHTTRMVLELSPDYHLDPQQVKVWGLTSHQWVVQLPDPTAPPAPVGAAPKAAAPRVTVPANSDPLPPLLSRNQVSYADVIPTATVIQGVQATPNGFFLPTQGAIPQVQIYRTRDPNQARQLVIDVLDAAIPPNLNAETLPQDRYGIHRWNVTQFRTAPPAVRITLTLDAASPDWQVSALNQGGIVIAPVGLQASQIQPSSTTVVLPVISPSQVSPPPPSTSPPPSPPPATVATPPPAPPVAVAPRPPAIAQATAPPPNRGRIVVMLDPGHGGADPGAIGIGGLQEKGVALAVAQHTAAALSAQGIIVQMTRQGDQTVDLQPRVDQAEAATATVFVSIHANAVNMQRPEVNGLETYYYSEAGATLATVLHRRVLGSLTMNDRGVRQARFFVLRRTSMPAALIEIGFVTGATDAPKLRDPQWQAQMGQAIANGVLDYLRTGP